jgi:hypothetical protein
MYININRIQLAHWSIWYCDVLLWPVLLVWGSLKVEEFLNQHLKKNFDLWRYFFQRNVVHILYYMYAWKQDSFQMHYED